MFLSRQYLSTGFGYGLSHSLSFFKVPVKAAHEFSSILGINVPATGNHAWYPSRKKRVDQVVGIQQPVLAPHTGGTC